MSNLEEFAQKNKLKFKDKDLLRTVFTHRSYLNEASQKELEHNERLEFLGDAVLELIVTEYLYLHFTNPEGELTNWRSAIVKGEVLAKVGAAIGIGDYLLLSKGEEKSGGRTRSLILANTLEALIGAIYLDAGYAQAKEFISEHIIKLLPEVIEKKLYQDPKSYLQEVCQEQRGITPDYRVMSEEGPDHAKNFTVGVYLGKELIAQGEGSSKQRGEQAAAQAALKALNG